MTTICELVETDMIDVLLTNRMSEELECPHMYGGVATSGSGVRRHRMWDQILEPERELPLVRNPTIR